MLKLFSIVFMIMKQNLKSIISYPKSFILEFIGDILLTVVGILFINIVFWNIPTIQGMGKYEVILIYVFAELNIGIFTAVFGGIIFNFGYEYILCGKIEKFIIQPCDTYFLVLFSKANFPLYGDQVFLFIYFIYALEKCRIEINIFTIINIILMFFLAQIILINIFSLITSLNFYIKNSEDNWLVFWNMLDFSKYPTSIYPAIIQKLLTFIIPLAFISYKPILYLFSQDLVRMLIAIFINIILFIGIKKIFENGLKSYESCGS